MGSSFNIAAIQSACHNQKRDRGTVPLHRGHDWARGVEAASGRARGRRDGHLRTLPVLRIACGSYTASQAHWQAIVFFPRNYFRTPLRTARRRSDLWAVELPVSIEYGAADHRSARR
jgi:hypothetical protein